jgi:hypothetical protein
MYLKPKISGEEARILLTQKKKFFREKYFQKKAELTRVELIYLPILLFEADLEGKTVQFQRKLSVDALTGYPSFFYADENDLDTERPEAVCTEFLLSEEEALKVAKEYCRGYFLEQGLRVRQHATLLDIRYLKQLYFPFWVGYFKKSGKYDFKAVDAISGASQGVRLRKIFLKAFRILGAPNNEK